ncbi:hypothetical protein [Gracilibacillus suaedae]|uniref:hypothetical protein n=1 Tax=Gracilibacillus suaedae TaxID=2820273 RepID=UPI001ABE5636|nr:hypothetical protein [Gracilibacillus suaedae]
MMTNELRNFTEADNVEYGEVEITLEESTLEEYKYDKQEVVNAFKEETENIKEGSKNTKIEFEKQKVETSNSEIGTQSIIDRRTYYIARVWSGIPAIGLDSSIIHNFNATTRDGYIKSISLRGSSYEKGFIKLSKWTHNDSWYEINSQGVVCQH